MKCGEAGNVYQRGTGKMAKMAFAAEGVKEVRRTPWLAKLNSFYVSGI